MALGLPVLTLALAAGILLADHGGVTSSGARVAVVGATLLALAPRVPPWGRFGAAVLLSAAAGALALATRLEAAAVAVPPSAVIEARVRDVLRAPTWFRLELDEVSVAQGGRVPFPSRILLTGSRMAAGVPAIEDALPGTRVRARVRLRKPAGVRNPGRPDREPRLVRRGIGAVATLSHPSLHARLPADTSSEWIAPLHRLRRRIGDRLALGGAAGALLQALAVGERSALPEETRRGFARLGISHLLAISGLHLALLAAAVYGTLRRGLGRLPWVSARIDARAPALAAALLAAGVYAFLAGLGVPVRRAWILLAAMGVSLLRRRISGRLAPLWAAAALVLAWQPDALFLAGAQMSFVASAALLAVAGRPGVEASHAPRILGPALHASATAILVTLPLAAIHLGLASRVGLFANVAAVPWAGFILLPAALLAAAVIAVAPGSGLETLVVGAATAVARVTLDAAATLGGHVPDAALVPLGPGVWVVGAAAALLAISRAGLAARGLAAALLPLVVASLPPQRVPPEQPRAVFLDVGQGDTVLLQTGEAAVLIDAGRALPDGFDAGREIVLPALRALGVERLDLVVASHADVDHRGGLPAVLRALPVDEVWAPRGASRDPGFDALRAHANARGVRFRERGAGDPGLRLAGITVEPLWPPAGAAGSRNDRSLVLRVDLAGRRILLPGDLEASGEAALLAAGVDLRAEVLKLAHHGSRTSSTGRFLAAVDAAVAVASAPCRGRFGMPHEAVRARVASTGAALWWTGRDGAVLVGLEPLRVRGFGARPRDCEP